MRKLLLVCVVVYPKTAEMIEDFFDTHDDILHTIFCCTMLSAWVYITAVSMRLV